jgi:hypothetical protein
LSLIELMVALPIAAMLLTATMVAIDASFKAYGSAAEEAGTQAAARMVSNRLLTLIRTSSAHGPLQSDAPKASLSGDTVTSSYIQFIDPQGRLMTVEYRAADEELWLVIDKLDGTTPAAQPLIGGVVAASFTLQRRRNESGLFVLERATIDMRVAKDQDNTLAIESGDNTDVRVVASTMPRLLD